MTFAAGGGALYFCVYDPSTGWHGASLSSTNSAALLDHNWHLVVATRDASGVATVTLDSTAASASGSSYPVNTGGTPMIGNCSAGYYFDGTLDEVRIYNTALNATQVAALYNQVSPSITAPTPTNSSNSGAYSA